MTREASGGLRLPDLPAGGRRGPCRRRGPCCRRRRRGRYCAGAGSRGRRRVDPAGLPGFASSFFLATLRLCPAVSFSEDLVRSSRLFQVASKPRRSGFSPCSGATPVQPGSMRGARSWLGGRGPGGEDAGGGEPRGGAEAAGRAPRDLRFGCTERLALVSVRR